MAEEVEIQTEIDVQGAERRKSYAQLAEDNQKLIEENTKLTKKVAKDAADNKKILKQILEQVIGDTK